MKYFVIMGILLIGFISVNVFSDAFGEPTLYDDNLILEEFTREFGWGYTTMTFVEDDILLLEKKAINILKDSLFIIISPNQQLIRK